MRQKKVATQNNFALRITKEGLYNFLVREADKKNWSVNTLINNVLDDYKKNNKKKSAESIV